MKYCQFWKKLAKKKTINSVLTLNYASQLSYDVLFDKGIYRCRIVCCSCSCAFKASWCQHVVAVCLHRIHRSHEVEYRVTIWDSINELTNEKLKKFAQFLINDLPRQVVVLRIYFSHSRFPSLPTLSRHPSVSFHSAGAIFSLRAIVGFALDDAL